MRLAEVREHQESRSLAQRTLEYERFLLDRHLAALKTRPIQRVSAGEVARLLRGMRDTHSTWVQSQVFRVIAGTFAFALRRGIVTRNPVDALAPSERPSPRNAKKIRVLDPKEMARLVSAGRSERWRAAVGLAGYAGLRLGEIRGLTWADVDFGANAIYVRRSLLDDGTPKAPKTAAGVRTIPMLPALRRLLAAWKLRSPRTHPTNLVICTADGSHVLKGNLRRELELAKTKAKLDGGEERLSWHSLRHSFASTLATDLELPATTLARITGHADAGFTLKVYARDGRDEATVISDVLSRAAEAKVGS